ncbi:MAG: methyltransferase [Duncaniella sp.]|nr:methyltransferase [Muribaculum sp.]MCM1255578.1 methyltransferase [Duncaniella sp.]
MGKFQFKEFAVDDTNSAMKVGTDGVLLGAWADVRGVRSVLDIGCGSGLIALMMAQRVPDALITGVEIDGCACMDAESNAKISKWADRIRIVNGDIRDFDESFESPLLILSNPPFFTENLHSPDVSRAQARHESEFGIKELIYISSRLMKSAGDSLAFIAPSGRNDEIEFLLALNRLEVIRRFTVFSRDGRNPFRTLWQVGKDGENGVLHPEISYLCIRNKDNVYTEEYINLTSDFYLDK